MKITNKSGTAPKNKTKVGVPGQLLKEPDKNFSYSPSWYENNDLAAYNGIKPVNVKNPIANHKLTAQDPNSRFWGTNSKDIRKATKSNIREQEVW